jgi:hypothetical protein
MDGCGKDDCCPSLAFTRVLQTDLLYVSVKVRRAGLATRGEVAALWRQHVRTAGHHIGGALRGKIVLAVLVLSLGHCVNPLHVVKESLHLTLPIPPPMKCSGSITRTSIRIAWQRCAREFIYHVMLGEV